MIYISWLFCWWHIRCKWFEMIGVFGVRNHHWEKWTEVGNVTETFGTNHWDLCQKRTKHSNFQMLAVKSMPGILLILFGMPSAARYVSRILWGEDFPRFRDGRCAARDSACCWGGVFGTTVVWWSESYVVCRNYGMLLYIYIIYESMTYDLCSIYDMDSWYVKYCILYIFACFKCHAIMKVMYTLKVLYKILFCCWTESEHLFD